SFELDLKPVVRKGLPTGDVGTGSNTVITIELTYAPAVGVGATYDVLVDAGDVVGQVDDAGERCGIGSPLHARPVQVEPAQVHGQCGHADEEGEHQCHERQSDTPLVGPGIDPFHQFHLVTSRGRVERLRFHPGDRSFVDFELATERGETSDPVAAEADLNADDVGAQIGPDAGLAVQGVPACAEDRPRIRRIPTRRALGGDGSYPLGDVGIT